MGHETKGSVVIARILPQRKNVWRAHVHGNALRHPISLPGILRNLEHPADLQNTGTDNTE